MDKNFVHLEGTIGTDFKYGTASNGQNYATFTLCIQSYFRETQSETEGQKPVTYVRIFVYGQKQVSYLRKVGAHSGCRATVFGKLNSCGTEIKGTSIVQNNVVVRDIGIIKQKEQQQ